MHQKSIHLIAIKMFIHSKLSAPEQFLSNCNKQFKHVWEMLNLDLIY